MQILTATPNLEEVDVDREVEKDMLDLSLIKLVDGCQVEDQYPKRVSV